jgi:hypothetical protein
MKYIPHLLKWGSASVFEIYPTLDLMYGEIVGLSHPHPLMNFYSIEKRNVVPILLDSIQAYEECIHYNHFEHTRVAFEMKWEEGLSDMETLRILDEARRKGKCNEHFYLSVPLETNLLRDDVSQRLKWRVKNVEKACNIVSNLGDIFEPIVELYSLWFIEKIVKHLPSLQGYLNLKIRNMKSNVRKYYRRFYPKVRHVLNKFESLGFVSKVDREYACKLLNYDREKMDVDFSRCPANPLDFIFSPKFPEIIPPLSLEASFENFNIEIESVIEQRFKTLLSLTKAKISDLTDFMMFAKEHDCKYLIPPNDHREVAIAFHEAAKVITRMDRRFRNIASISVPWTKNFGKFLEDIQKYRYMEDKHAAIVLTLVSYFCISSLPSMIINKSSNGSRFLYFNKYLAHSKMALIRSVVLRSLKYFLIDPRNKCPLFGIYDECPSCILLTPVHQRKKQYFQAPECPIHELIDDVKIKVIPNTQALA